MITGPHLLIDGQINNLTCGAGASFVPLMTIS